MKRLIFTFCALGVGFGAFGGLAEATFTPARVLAVEAIGGQSGGATITVTLDRPVAARTFTLANPDRFVVDVPGAEARFRANPNPGGLVKAIRSGARADGATRLVFDLTAPARIGPQPTNGGARLVYGLEPVSTQVTTASFAPSAISTAAPAGVAAVVAPPEPAPRHLIVIDAGHGGHDPGASGVAGTREKAVVLAAALVLRDTLEARGGYHVVLTRDGDVFLPLQERVRIARDNKAELFVSLHADSNGNRQAKGASVYTLSESGGARARDVMDAQDWGVDLGDSPHSAQVQRILVDLAQRETTNRSADFAQTLIGELDGAAPLLRNTHRNAGYFVLLAPDVPAVLIEMGFLTNTQDETRLADTRARVRMMGGVANAIDVYFAKSRAYAAR